MNSVLGLVRRFTQLGLLMFIGVIMSACSTSWREEVLLHDGSKIIVDRSVLRGGRHELGQRPSIEWQRLRFTMPATGERVTWEDSPIEEGWYANFSPMLLDVKDGVAYLVVHPMGCYSYGKWGRPNPPYVVFSYKDGKWKRITLKALPTEVRKPNLVFSSPDEEVKKIGKSIISANTIQKIYAGYRQPEYKTILREPMVGTGCSVPSDAAARLIAPTIEEKPLYYNWWPLAIDWLKDNCRGCDLSPAE